MARSKWKGYFLSKNLLKTPVKIRTQRDFRIWARNSIVPKFLVGKSVFVHNGKQFIKTFISREKVGFKFGEFSFTRKHTKKEVKAKTKKK